MVRLDRLQIEINHQNEKESLHGDELTRGMMCLSSDLEDNGADGQQRNNPSDGDQEASVDRQPLQAPASGQYSSESLAGKCLWQDIADIPATILFHESNEGSLLYRYLPQVLWHSLQRPDDARQ